MHHSIHLHFKIFSQIRIQLFDLMQKIHVAANICFRANIRLQFSHTGEYLLQNIGLEANVHKTLSKFHIKANIRLQMFAYKRIFGTFCFKLSRKAF
jgi:hypothetical protein